MAGWEFLAQMLNSRDEDRRQKERFQQQRALESQRSVDNASERAANYGAEADLYQKKKDIDQTYADKDAVNAGKVELAKFLASKGINPELLKAGDEVFEKSRMAYIQEKNAAAQAAKTSGLESEIKGEGLGATRGANLRRLVSQADEGATRADMSKNFVSKNPQAVEAGMLGQELAPALGLARANTMQVGAGDYLKRLTTGNSAFDTFFPGVEGQGMTQQKQTTMQNIGGMPYPTEQMQVTPGSIKQVYSGKIPQVSAAAPRATGQMQGPQMPASVPTPSAVPAQQQGDNDLRNLPPEIARLISSPQYTPEAKQQIIQGYFNGLVEQAKPSILSRFLSPDESTFQMQEYNKRKKMLTPNY